MKNKKTLLIQFIRQKNLFGSWRRLVQPHLHHVQSSRVPPVSTEEEQQNRFKYGHKWQKKKK